MYIYKTLYPELLKVYILKAAAKQACFFPPGNKGDGFFNCSALSFLLGAVTSKCPYMSSIESQN